MSGFFRYVLSARWMAGADVVAELLGLPEKMRVCDCMITGEGSFDEQTIRYNKTLGRLLQLVVLENLRRRERGQAILGDVIVVCGRTSYRDAEEVRSVLIDHMRVQKEYKSDDASLVAAVPRVHLLPLTPRHFTVPEALGNAGACVEKRIMWYVSGTEGDAPHVATTPARKCSAKL
ncbi:putative glycerate kinase [Trypanosoma grayi]|uniref:putative glycerate kinase n=1 Tax=Trypanosoma grayi TaxID=71804 RepID=UPI0004F3F238|nr:putative glycerate kinase [Trypanosoma grayi]KEG06194.1 putative glycerate kinase [Trypanosoma grayi]